MPSEWMSRYLTLTQRAMLSKLEQIRHGFRHKGNRGTSAEEEIRDFIRSIIPKTQSVHHGEVICTDERTSGQLDVVVLQDFHPDFFDTNQPGIFFAEGVQFVAEVKTLLDTSQLIDVLESCRNVKSLLPKYDQSVEIWANASDINRFVDRIPYILICYESKITLDKMYREIEDYYKSCDNDLKIDGIFVLSRGVIENLGDGLGSYRYINDGQPLTGFRIFESDSDGDAMISLLRFIVSLPNVRRSQNFLRHYLV